MFSLNFFHYLNSDRETNLLENKNTFLASVDPHELCFKIYIHENIASIQAASSKFFNRYV